MTAIYKQDFKGKPWKCIRSVKLALANGEWISMSKCCGHKICWQHLLNSTICVACLSSIWSSEIWFGLVDLDWPLAQMANGLKSFWHRLMYIFVNYKLLTHWGRVTHVCARSLNWVIIGSGNDLSPVCEAVCWYPAPWMCTCLWITGS